jgi:hypothetical protein
MSIMALALDAPAKPFLDFFVLTDISIVVQTPVNTIGVSRDDKAVGRYR